MTKKDNTSTLVETFKSLGGAIKALNDLLPLFIVFFSAIIFWIVYFIISNSQLIKGTTVLVVLLVSIIIYFKSKNYGEAALSLVAGLLTVFTVEWTSKRFIVFIVSCLGFTFISLMISSVRIAAQEEEIYRQASINISAGTDKYKKIEKDLKQIAKNLDIGVFGPIERAEIIRLLCFKKIPIDQIPFALRSVATISVITRVDYKTVSMFVADIYKILEISSTYGYNWILDKIYLMIRETPVPPQEFIEAFERSRRLIFSKKVKIESYFEILRSGLESGVSIEDINEYIITNS